MSVTMNHTGIVVTDIEEAVKFYCEGIGLSMRFQVEAGGAELSQLLGYDDVQVKAAFVGGIDGHSVEIIEYLSPKSEVRDAGEQHKRNTTGATHISFNVTDMDSIIERIVPMGAVLNNPPVALMDGFRSIYLQDPWGNWIELDEDSVHNEQQFTIHQRTSVNPSPGDVRL
ncbi:MAG: Catechol 2,3-dioxygenase [Chloroflexi bacterium]|jgi:predicted enzyme related to lactoylglutathione lyase|nr:MAG: Catechol 2,3-dioxygenase [Chloroflexota bacterium]